MRQQRKTIRQRLFPLFLSATAIPILLFAAISQYRLRSSFNENINMQIEKNLNQADESLNMVLDKYDTLLYEFCTNDEIAAMVQAINQKGRDQEDIESRLNQQMSHICNRNTGVLGITVVTESGEVLFYDSLTRSSASTVWADHVTVPEDFRGADYRGGGKAIKNGSSKIYYFQVSREMVDTQDISHKIGTIMLSVDERKFAPVLEVGDNAQVCLLQNDRIIAAQDTGQIGGIINSSDTRHNRYNSVINETSGFTIFHTYSLKLYRQTLWEQIVFWILMAVGGLVLITALTYAVARPYLQDIDHLAGAMNEIQQGNLQVRVPVFENQTVEIRKINDGFNNMAAHIEQLIAQVTEAVVDQKNAQLSALEAQIDPHFLYNTLDSINWLAINHGEFEISEMLCATADMFRYSINASGEDTSIEQSINWLERFTLLQRHKLGQELVIEIQVPQELYGYRIHKLLIQPFVENAVKHGFQNKEGEPKLIISMRLVADQIHIIISDNGCGIEAEKLKELNEELPGSLEKEIGSHVGIQNVRKRLALYYGTQASLYFESVPGRYTRVHLFIPAISPMERQGKVTGEEVHQ